MNSNRSGGSADPNADTQTTGHQVGDESFSGDHAGAQAPGPEPRGPGPEPQALTSEGAHEVEERLARALAEAAEFRDQYLRAKAEAENVRRRAQEEVARAHKYGIEGFAESLLPVIDSLEAALGVDNASTETMREGIELTHRQLVAAFEKATLVALDPAGERFDPNLHQAISMVPAPPGVAANHVVSVLQKGWKIADRVLRPALVTVAQG